MNEPHSDKRAARRRQEWIVGCLVVGLLGLATLGCEQMLINAAESITGVPLEGYPTPTVTVTSTPTTTPTIVPTPTPNVPQPSGPVGPVAPATPTVTATATVTRTATATPTVTGTPSGPVVVQFDTSLGSFQVQLNNAAPITVANFLTYVNAGFYSGTIFHRSVQSGIFIVQGGGFLSNGVQKPTNAPIVLEDNVGLTNVRGTIAMARTSAPDSATCQFFFNNQDNPGLNRNGSTPGYAVFGTVISGMTVVDDIAALPIVDASSINPAFNEKPSPGGVATNFVVISNVFVVP